MPKIQPTAAQVPSVRSQAVTRPSAPAVNSLNTKAAPGASFAGQTLPTRELIPNGKPVATSATPNALWGEQPKPVSLDREAFVKLAPAQQKEIAVKALEEREQVRGDIEARVEHLDKKWKNSRLTTRTDALREYEEKGERLTPRRRQQLGKLLDRSEAAQRRINELRAQADKLPKTPEAKAQMAELRSAIAKELRRARDEQSQVVKEATEVVDAEGLKVDRLATTEQIIDPQAPAPGTGDSLIEKIARFFHLDGFITFFTTVFNTWTDVFKAESERQENSRLEKADQQRADDQRVRLDDQTRLKTLREALAYLNAPVATAAAS